MGIIELLAGLFRGKPGKDGLWDFLGKWAISRTQVKLEQVHNDGTQKLIPLLQPGTVVIERGRGWTREIRMPEARPPGAPLNAATSQPPVPLLPAPRNELEAAPLRPAQDPADDPS